MPDIDILSTIGVTLLLVSFFAGFIDAIAGGGGMLTIPAFLFAGIPPHFALGINKLCGTFGSFTSSLTYYNKGLFTFSPWKWHVLFTAIGAIAGTLLVELISVEWLYKLLPAIIFSVSLFSLAKRFMKTKAYDDANKIRKRSAAAHGLTLGAYDGVAGPGTGSFWTLSLQMFYGLPLLNAIAATKLMNFTSNFVSLATFFWLGYVDVALGISLGIALMLGSYAGAQVTLKLPINLIAILFNILVIAISIRLAMIHWF